MFSVILPNHSVRAIQSMISKSRIKSIKQLELKKFRRQTGLFVAEGPKVVGDLLEVMPAETLIGTD